MLNIPGRRDLVIALVGRMVSTFGDGVALVALTLRLQADGAHPYEVGLLLAGRGHPAAAARPPDRAAGRRPRLPAPAGRRAAWRRWRPRSRSIFLHSVVPIVLLVAVLGAAASLTGATWSALIPRVVGEDHLAEAVSAQQSLSVLALVGAPAVGGLLAGAFGSGVPVALDAATFVVVTVAAALVRTRRVPERAPAAEGRAGSGSGFAILRADRSSLPSSPAWPSSSSWSAWSTSCWCTWSATRSTPEASGTAWPRRPGWRAWWRSSLGAGRVRTEPGQVRATIAGAALACAGVAGFAVAPAVGILVPLSVLGGVGNGYAGACLSTSAHDAHARQRPRPGVRHRQCGLRGRPGRLAPARRRSSRSCCRPARSTPLPACSAWPPPGSSAVSVGGFEREPEVGLEPTA